MIKLTRRIASIALVIFAKSSLALTIPSGGTMNMPASAAMGLACTQLNIQGLLSLNGSVINQASLVDIGAPGVFDAGSSTINVSGDWNNDGSFNAGTSTVIFGNSCTTAPITLSGNTTFYNLTLSSSSGTTFVIPGGHSITVLGHLTLLGDSANPIQLTSSTGQAYITLGPGAVVTSNYANVSGTVRISGITSAIPTLGTYAHILLAALLTLSFAWQLKGFRNSRRDGRSDKPEI